MPNYLKKIALIVKCILTPNGETCIQVYSYCSSFESMWYTLNIPFLLLKPSIVQVTQAQSRIYCYICCSRIYYYH